MRMRNIPLNLIKPTCIGESRGICIDSRNLEKGQLFFALKGKSTDGHHYLKSVAEKGASSAVVFEDYAGDTFGMQLIRVPDVMEALHKLTRDLLKISNSKIVAITGSLGKTTTKDFTATFLKKRYRVGISKGNHNSQLGLPLSILNDTHGDEDILVLEMGMTHPGNLKQLITFAPPDIAVLTSVDLVHAENFNSLEEISHCKSEIFTHSNTQLGIISRDIPSFTEIFQSTCRKLSFSILSPCADFFLEIENNSEKLILRDENGDRIALPFPTVPGKHNLHNMLAAIAVARTFNLDWVEIAEAIPSLNLPERRLEEIHINGIMFINDSYNAALTSMKSALLSLGSSNRKGQKIAFLGGIRELGKFSEECHKEVGNFALDHADMMYCLGEECLPIYDIWRSANRPVWWSKDRSSLVKELKNALMTDDTVLLKGSNAWELWKVLDEV